MSKITPWRTISDETLERWSAEGHATITGTGNRGVIVERKSRAFLIVERTMSREYVDATLAPFHAFYDDTVRVTPIEITHEPSEERADETRLPPWPDAAEAYAKQSSMTCDHGHLLWHACRRCGVGEYVPPGLGPIAWRS